MNGLTWVLQIRSHHGNSWPEQVDRRRGSGCHQGERDQELLRQEGGHRRVHEPLPGNQAVVIYPPQQ